MEKIEQKENFPKLNKDQLEAVNTISGNLLIVASAGTGKTTTIVERYVNLVENHGFGRDEILMTTFTNKAAKDMVEKIAKRTNKIPYYAGTMHSIFLKILRDHATLVRKNRNFTIIDEGDKKKIIRQILLEKGIDTRAEYVKYFIGRIGKFKNTGTLAGVLEPELSDFSSADKIEVEMDEDIIYINEKIKAASVIIYKKYDDYLKDKNLIDLDDILLLTFRLFDEYKLVRDKYSRQFKAIMVDEAQDLNVVQMKILELLQNDNLCLIGDDCQNIYEWRGSSNELVFRFSEKHNKIVLKDNYRSSQNIICAVNKTIDSMQFKINKELVCTRDKGSKIIIDSFNTFEEEVFATVFKIKELIKKGTSKEDIAVLFRTNNIGKLVEREFRKNKIPCYLSKAKHFMEREEIKDVLAFLKLKLNPSSWIDFERVCGLLEGVGKVKLAKIHANMDLKKSSAIEAVEGLKLNEVASFNLNLLKEALSQEGNPIDIFLEKLKYFRHLSNEYTSDTSKIEDKMENIKVLLEMFIGTSFNEEGIRSFLDGLLEIDRKEKHKDKVTLSTIHSAKGLEWKHVFLVSCNEKVLPYYTNVLTSIKRDAELRLFYVAISRAKDFLTISYSEWDKWKQKEPSQFLELISSVY